jgi:hypothetical protein
MAIVDYLGVGSGKGWREKHRGKEKRGFGKKSGRKKKGGMVNRE